MPKRNIAKTRKNPLLYIPSTLTFSELESVYENQSREFDVSDNGQEVDESLQKLYGIKMLLDILYNLEEREKIIYLYQVLREFGYEVDHGTLAKTMGIHRVIYMNNLKIIRDKIKLMLTKTNYNME